MTTPRTAIFYSEASTLHDTGRGHPEHAGRMSAALEGSRRAGLAPQHLAAQHLAAGSRDETDRWIVATHAPDYRRRFEEAVEQGLPLFESADNPISAGSFSAARGAVAAALHAADAIWESTTLDRAFVIARPPGHHAERAGAMGFCFFNTIAVVADRLRTLPGIERVFIFDWDVHHGNGTQHLFEERSDVFYASAHRYPFYPGTGASRENGIGTGAGATLNLPFDEGATDADYLRAIDGQLMPALDTFQPDAILISAGFDAHQRDPLGGMRLTEEAYREMTSRMVDAAVRHCNGRVLSLLEGGYDLPALASSVAVHVDELTR